MTTRPAPSAEYFDEWYANLAASHAKDEIVRRHLGLPPHMLSTSLLGWDGVADVSSALRLSPGLVLADLACGRGGYGMEIAHRTGARLVGVDFSAEAIRQARECARRLRRTARFEVGSLAATGLPDSSVHAVICIDAIQFAEPTKAALLEIRRVLAPGGRAVLTCWEAVDPRDDRVPAPLRRLDLRAGLTSAGFVDVVIDERPDWQAVERTLWLEAAALEPDAAPTLDADPALRSFHDEAVRVLDFEDRCRRIMASATAPSAKTAPAQHSGRSAAT